MYSSQAAPKSPLRRVLFSVNFTISKVSAVLAGGLLGLMVLMILAQVFYRYILNDSLAWTEELAKFTMVWIACLVAPWAYRENLNVSIQMFADALPLVVRQISEWLITTLVIVVCSIFLIQSIEFCIGGWTITASSMPIRLAYFYACAPFAFGSICLVGLEKWLTQSIELFSVAFSKDK